MAAIDEYRPIVRRVVKEYGEHKPSHGEIDAEVIIDADERHFEVLLVGWDGQIRVHSSIIHIDIIGDRIWIQHDRTSPGIAEDLLEAGIPREAIVLGFRPTYVRPYTGFATG